MSKYDDLFFGDNLKILRKSWGETQQAVARMLDITQHTFSQYETKERFPNDQILLKIANHFCVPIESLLFEDLSYLIFEGKKTWPNIDLIKKSLQIEFPIVYSNEALENSKFTLAVKAHTKLIRSLSSTQPDNDFALNEDVLDWYEEAANNRIIEAKANIIGYFLLNYSITLSQLCVDLALEDDDSEIEFFHTINKYRMVQNSEIGNDIRAAYYDIVKNDLFGYIHDLKLSGKYADLADYYIMRLYQFALADKNISVWKSNEVAAALLTIGKRLKNPYICRFYNQAEKVLSEE